MKGPSALVFLAAATVPLTSGCNSVIVEIITDFACDHWGVLCGDALNPLIENDVNNLLTNTIQPSINNALSNLPASIDLSLALEFPEVTTGGNAG